MAHITITYRWHLGNPAAIQAIIHHKSDVDVGEMRSIAFAGHTDAGAWAHEQLHALMTMARYAKAVIQYNDQLNAAFDTIGIKDEGDADDDFDWNR